MGRVNRFGALLGCALMTLALIGSAAAAVQPDALAWRNATSLPDLVEHLEEWLDRNTDLPRSKTTPEIQIISVAEAAQLQTSYQALTRGLYEPQDSTIYLVRPWDKRNPFDAAVLLHELVHHRQNGDRHWYCPGAQELPAYRTQERWLAEMGLEADINWIAVILEAGCTPRDIHPD